ncbi:MAG: uracil-DNA glycosylase, partial [Parachlamydiales bacterium]
MAEELLMETGWLEELGSEFSAPYMQRLKSFLILEKKLGRVLYPPENLIFNALCQTPFAKVKAVIVGQDPYHGKNQAHGLCFSVPKGVRIPPSLQNIFKELEQDLGLPPPASGDLSFWAKQGVLLLNATLTVREAEPLSHFGQGWEEFTDRIIEKLTKRSDPLVFLLWGKSAQQKVGRVFSKSP